MLHIVLFEPEIPPNTGNIIRLAANTGTQLHLIKPLGFELDDKRLQRAGLDYHEFANLEIYESYEDFLEVNQSRRIFAITSKATKNYHNVDFSDEDMFLFGPETRGLPEEIRNQLGSEHCLRLPMLKQSRSLNLSNAVSIIVYEAWRQIDFQGSG